MGCGWCQKNRVRNAATSLSRIPGDIVKGDYVDNFEKKRRFNICNGCKYYKPKKRRCKQCGCFLRWKTLLKSQQCPEGYWKDTKKYLKEGRK